MGDEAEAALGSRVAEHPHGIDASGPHGWHRAGQKHDRHEQHSGARERGRVDATNAVVTRLEQAAGDERDQTAEE